MSILSAEELRNFMCHPEELTPAKPTPRGGEDWLWRFDTERADPDGRREWEAQVDHYTTLHEASSGIPLSFASAADCYHVFKAMKRAEKGVVEEYSRAQTLLNAVREDFEGPLLTSTLIQRNPNNFVTITHHAGHSDRLYHLTDSARLPGIESGCLIVQSPLYIEPSIHEFLQALFRSNDTWEEMLQVLGSVSGVPRQNLGYSCNFYELAKEGGIIAFAYDRNRSDFILTCEGKTDAEGVARGIQLTPNDITVLKEGWQ